MTAGPETTIPRFYLRLPGSWWRIPLDSEQGAETAIRKMIEESLGRADELATVRHQLREHVSEAVARARRGDAEVMFFAREVLEGVPLPVSLTVLRPDIELDVMVASQPERNLPLLERALKRAEHSADDERWRAFLSQGAAIVRSVAAVEGSVPGDQSAPLASTVVVDYWAVASGSIRPIVFSFSSSMTQLADSLIELFDAIIESISWPTVADGIDASSDDAGARTGDSVS